MMSRRILPLSTLCGLLVLAGVAPAWSAQEHSCVFTLSMTGDAAINNLEFKVDYSAADGEVEGSGASAVCRRSLGGSLAAFNDNDASRLLKVGIVRLTQFTGPVVLGGCRFFYDTTIPVADDFHISVQVAAKDGEDINVNPLPKVQVTAIECPGELPGGTTTTSTSTTVPVTSTTLIDGGECGFPVSSGDTPTASDALFTLRAAVGLASCPKCVCDVDGSDKVAASDALAILRVAVGVGGPFACPSCS